MIDLFSDTATKPTPAMRAAIASAEVGDEQRNEDPTVNALQERVAALLGKEAALYLPSGAMCNQIAYCVWCEPGDEIILDRSAHPLNFEAGGATALRGVLFHAVEGPRGIFDARAVSRALRPKTRYAPQSRVVSIEQTTNLGGGAVWPIETIDVVSALARDHGLRVHIDGARLLNAVVASGIPAARYARDADSVWIDFSKGLGAPVGAVLAGSRAFIERAWVWKQRLGGAMRQAGIIAAACLYALDHHVERLAEDHANAKRLAARLAEIPGFAIDPASVETNILIVDCHATGESASALAERIATHAQVRVSVMAPTLIRLVTHLDVDTAMCEEAAERISRCLERVP